jgi:hypothetical protein
MSKYNDFESRYLKLAFTFKFEEYQFSYHLLHIELPMVHGSFRQVVFNLFVGVPPDIIAL